MIRTRATLSSLLALAFVFGCASPGPGYKEYPHLDETMAVSDGDVVLVPRGHHPCGAPYGHEMYYLNVMAGPMRKWRFKTHPDFAWIVARDSAPEST